MTTLDEAAEVHRYSGRTRITSRALKRVVMAVAAEALDIKAAQLGVDLLDSEGQLALVVSAPIPVASLPRIDREPLIVSRTGGTILERAGHAQEQIRHDVGAITGSIIARVTIRLTGAQIRDMDRVK